VALKSEIKLFQVVKSIFGVIFLLQTEWPLQKPVLQPA